VPEAALTLASFEPLVGSQFTLWLDDFTQLPALLLEARAAPSGACQREPFSLTFEAPAEPALPQSTYRLVHPGFDTALDIFLVPVARSASGLHYEAIFS
jgi:hypothetical protein